MQSANNLIFNSTIALAGNWANINNYTNFSIHIVGLESGANTWIEVSNNPNVILNPPSAYIQGYNNPILYPATKSSVLSGIPITGNLCAGVGTAPYGSPPLNYAEDVNFSADATQCVWSPSNLAWNFVRIVKTGGGSTLTSAYFFGQLG